MAETPTQTDKFNEGRLIAGIGLQYSILQNGVLPEQTLEERAIFVKGMLQGLIENKKWQQALGLLYQKDGPLKFLLDKTQNESLTPAIIEAAKNETKGYSLQGSWYGGTEIASLVSTHWKPEDVFTLLTETPLSKEDRENLFNINHRKFTEQQKQQYHNENGERELAAGKYDEACQHFDKTGNYVRISQIQKQLEQNLTQQNFRTTLHLAERYTIDNELVKRIVRTALDKFPEEIDEYDKEQIYRLYPDKIQLKPEEAKKLKKNHAQRLSSWDIERDKPDDETKLYWAQAHTTPKTYNDNDSILAYEIMAEQKYEGPERWTALITNTQHAIKNYKWQDFAETTKYEDVLKIQSQLTLEERAWTALIYDDKENMRKYSKQIAREATKQKNIKLTQQAYKLWVIGNGDQNDAYVTTLRQELLEHDLQEIKEKGYGGIGDWLERNDKVGHIEISATAFPLNLERAYELAKYADEQALIKEAAKRIVADSPEDALCKHNKDPLIRELAIDALTTKYNVDKTRLTELVKNHEHELR
ncbi:hypothetical protein HY485_01070 [Candidatus Woesearchaeota archaeon]|nr:hypothetical protein [Candidatus Woesearchaeota archaeon]